MNSTQKSKSCRDGSTLRHNWSLKEIGDIYSQPFFTLLHEAHSIHKAYNNDFSIQLASLLNVKTGGCPEDCKYCSQSAHYKKNTKLKPEKLISANEIIEKAKKAKENGADRFCIGTAWRNVPNNADFLTILEAIKGIRALELEACATLGMLNEEQALKLAEAGLTAYNHNIDTSPEHYKNITSTRTFSDRIETLKNVRQAGLQVCCGGILGIGEKEEDRISFLRVLSSMNPHPESVPFNVLVPIKGTPFENNLPVDPFDLIKIIAVARILMPKSRIRLSAGRKSLSQETQILCYYAGANSIFYGEKLLTTANAKEFEDEKLLKKLGLMPQTEK